MSEKAPCLESCLTPQSMNASIHKPDTLNSEFVYYSSVLKLLTGALTNELDKKKILPWAKKLFRPEYHSTQFREKRNKYLLYLTITLLNDEAFGIFTIFPPDGALPDLESMEKPEFPVAEWERDTTWQDNLNGLSKDFVPLVCSVHENEEECKADHQLDKILDQEFKFLLYLLRPYAALFQSSHDRLRVATWMQTLSSIAGCSCSSMRGIRNDYLMALLGYVQNLQLIGPFAQYPPIAKLPTLAEAARLASESRPPLTDPTGPEVNEFLSRQPVPEEGAFCYIALTGDLLSALLPDEDSGPIHPRENP